jgi:hypothetical protein
VTSEKTEAQILNEIRLAVAPHCTISRNNCGGLKDTTGRFVKFGLFNPGGADLIGWKTITITPEMVGQKIAQFVGLEVKSATGRIRPEQENFLRVLKASGGLCGVVRSPAEALGIVDAVRIPPSS